MVERSLCALNLDSAIPAVRDGYDSHPHEHDAVKRITGGVTTIVCNVIRCSSSSVNPPVMTLRLPVAAYSVGVSPPSIVIRKTHPGLYRSLMVLGATGIALGLNFLFSTPTFNPYGIPKGVVGAVFMLLGVGQVAALNVFHSLRMVRIVLAVSVGVMFFWGLSNAQQFFDGRASLQLPILYVALSLLQVPLLIESPVNPMTEKK